MSMKSTIILLILIFIFKCMSLVTVVDVGILPLVKNSVGIIFFIDVTNEDRQNVCELISQCKRCCFIDANKEDCDVTGAFGDDYQIIKPRDRKTLLYVFPMLVQHDLVGYCKILLIYDFNKTKEEIYVTVPLNTRVGVKKSKAIMNQYIGGNKKKICNSLDEDSLNNCEPVNCDMKYLGNKPIFDHVSNKCVEAPTCLTNSDRALPDSVYVPNGNTCRNLDVPLTVQDIYAIRTGVGTVTMSPNRTYQVTVKVKSNCSTISQNLYLLRDLMLGNICPVDSAVTVDYGQCIKSALFTIGACIVCTCTILFLLIYCINSAVWLYIQWSDGNVRKFWKVLKNFFKRTRGTKSKGDKVDTTINNVLLRDVIAKDVPLELRCNVVDVCHRMEKEVERKKRYRGADVGSQISLQRSRESSSLISSATSIFNDQQ